MCSSMSCHEHVILHRPLCFFILQKTSGFVFCQLLLLLIFPPRCFFLIISKFLIIVWFCVFMFLFFLMFMGSSNFILEESYPQPAKLRKKQCGGVYFCIYGTGMSMPIQQKLPPPMLRFSDFAGWVFISG